jgi:predicted nucleotide-binding protein
MVWDYSVALFGEAPFTGIYPQILLRSQAFLNEKEREEIEKIDFEPTSWNDDPLHGNNYDEMHRRAWNEAKVQLFNQLQVFIEQQQIGEPVESSKGIDMPKSRKIFVVHGHDGEVKQTVARFIEHLDFEAIILDEKHNASRALIEKVEHEGRDCHFAIVLLTPDDELVQKGDEKEIQRARQNVVFELGYFVGRLGRSRVTVIKKECSSFEIFSDLGGVTYVAWDKNGGWKAGLARELKAAGYSFDPEKVFT